MASRLNKWRDIQHTQALAKRADRSSASKDSRKQRLELLVHNILLDFFTDHLCPIVSRPSLKEKVPLILLASLITIHLSVVGHGHLTHWQVIHLPHIGRDKKLDDEGMCSLIFFTPLTFR